MKYKFVLDENVFLHALNGVDKFNNPDDSAKSLIENIAKNCHRIIVDKKLNKLFDDVLKSKKLKLKNRDDRLLETFKKIRSNAEKYLFKGYDAEKLEDLPEIENKNIPRKDKYIVKLAVKEEAQYIVTSDAEFKESITNNNLNNKIQCLDVKEALEKAKEK